MTTTAATNEVRRNRHRKTKQLVPTEHKHVYVQYGDAEPVCFRCYFFERRAHREGVLVTDAATRERVLNRYHRRSR
jgi:hypothetical protein